MILMDQKEMKQILLFINWISKQRNIADINVKFTKGFVKLINNVFYNLLNLEKLLNLL